MTRIGWITGLVIAIGSLHLDAADEVPRRTPPWVQIDGRLPPGTEFALQAELGRLHARLDRDLGIPERPVVIDRLSIEDDDVARIRRVSHQSTDVLWDACVERARGAYVCAYLQQRWPQHPVWLTEGLSAYYGSGTDEPLTAGSFQQLRATYHRNRRPSRQYIERLDVMPSIRSREYADSFIRLHPDW